MYPILLELENRPVLVVGGGQVASRKIKKLLAERANITVVSPDLDASIPIDHIHWIKRKFEFSDMAGFGLIFTCTDSPDLNTEIFERSRQGQFVNNTSDRYASDFYNMSTIDNDKFLFSVSSKGRSPKDTKAMRQKLERWLDKERKADE